MPVKTKEAVQVETVSIRAVKAFYINGKIIESGARVDSVPKLEALGYVATKKAVIADAPPPPGKPAQVPEPAKVKASAEKAEDKKKEEKKP